VGAAALQSLRQREVGTTPNSLQKEVTFIIFLIFYAWMLLLGAGSAQVTPKNTNLQLNVE
jgi:hypothetical protein